MRDRRNLKVEVLGPIARQVALFQVGLPLARLDCASFNIRVIERSGPSQDQPFRTAPHFVQHI
jgi:hypothetical protein